MQNLIIPMNRRKYKGEDAEMLIVTSTMIEAAIANKTFLQSKRSTWADPFFDNIVTRIDTATQNLLGLDTAKDLRAATLTVRNVQKNALTLLAEFKVQLVEDFSNDKSRRDELLNQLGFKTFHTGAQKGDQEAMINLLYQFKTNMTPALQAEISAKGTDPATITTIMGYADTLKTSNITQEAFKSTRKNITAEVLNEFNEIYDSVKSVGVISTKFFKGNPEVQQQFSYRKTLQTLNSGKEKKPAKVKAPVAA